MLCKGLCHCGRQRDGDAYRMQMGGDGDGDEWDCAVCKFAWLRVFCYITIFCVSVYICGCVCRTLTDSPNVVIHPESTLPREGEKFSLRCVGNGNPE